MCVPAEGDACSSVDVSGSDSSLPASLASQQTGGGFCCHASGCTATFSQDCQLANHYTERHECDFGPSMDKHDADLYHRYMSASQSTASGKRKRRTSRYGRPAKRTGTKSRYTVEAKDRRKEVIV